MLKKLIIPAIAVLAFTSNASALNAKGKFQKKTHKIKGAWALLEIENKQVLAFHDNFKTKNGADLKIVLSKKSIRNLTKNPTFTDPLSLGLIRSNTGDQNYIVPSNVNLEDYQSIVIHSEAENVLWGGFDIPSQNRQGGKRVFASAFDGDSDESDDGYDREEGDYGS